MRVIFSPQPFLYSKLNLLINISSDSFLNLGFDNNLRRYLSRNRAAGRW